MKLEAFDVETGGTLREYALQPFRAMSGDGWLTSFATASRVARGGELGTAEPGEIVTDGELRPSRRRLRGLLERYAATGVYVVCWNAPFDVAWMIALGFRDLVMRINWLDAMLLYKHVTSSPRYLPEEITEAPKSYGLKAAVQEFYPDRAGYDAGVDFEPDEADHAGWDNLLTYNALDCEHTLTLCEKFIAQLTPAQLNAALIEAACIPLIADTIVGGIATDGEASVVLSKRLQDEANLALVTLMLTHGGAHITPKLLASPTQLRTLLYKDWGLPIQKYTEHETNPQPSTDKEALMDLAELDDRARLIKDYREANNNRAKFAEGLITSVAYNGDGRTRPGPRVFGTYTGRLTYNSKTGRGKDERPTGCALHQWKRDKEFRAQLVAPEGYTLLEHDFAGQEFRWMAVESGDGAMLDLCQPGEDPHAFMAARIEREHDYRFIQANAGIDPAIKQTRQLGKFANLSMQYRIGHKTARVKAKTQYDLYLSVVETKAIVATYRLTYPGVVQYWKRQIYEAKRNGYAETQAGRRVQLGFGQEWDPDSQWSYESTAINFPIQGDGADQKYLALKVLRDYLPTVDGSLYYELHDGLFTIVPDRVAEKAAIEIRDLLSNLPYAAAWGKTFPILFPVDAKMGRSWGALKEVH